MSQHLTGGLTHLCAALPLSQGKNHCTVAKRCKRSFSTQTLSTVLLCYLAAGKHQHVLITSVSKAGVHLPQQQRDYDRGDQTVVVASSRDSHIRDMNSNKKLLCESLVKLPASASRFPKRQQTQPENNWLTACSHLFRGPFQPLPVCDLPFSSTPPVFLVLRLSQSSQPLAQHTGFAKLKMLRNILTFHSSSFPPKPPSDF